MGVLLGGLFAAFAAITRDRDAFDALLNEPVMQEIAGDPRVEAALEEMARDPEIRAAAEGQAITPARLWAILNSDAAWAAIRRNGLMQALRPKTGRIRDAIRRVDEAKNAAESEARTEAGTDRSNEPGPDGGDADRPSRRSEDTTRDAAGTPTPRPRANKREGG